MHFLDSVIPWGKQHIYLFTGPDEDIADWRKPDWVSQLLKQHRMGKYLNVQLPPALPEKMKVSSILHDSNRLRVTAIKRRDWWERNIEYDDSSETEKGDEVELRAFVHRVTRSLVAFEWNLVSNVATPQISQLPTGFDASFRSVRRSARGQALVPPSVLEIPPFPRRGVLKITGSRLSHRVLVWRSLDRGALAHTSSKVLRLKNTGRRERTQFADLSRTTLIVDPRSVPVLIEMR